MKIHCQERYDKIAEYAKEIGDQSFQSCIDRLKQWEKSSNGRYKIELTPDFAPHSMLFAESYTNGERGLNGGLIYHGSPDVSSSVQLVPKQGWQIHT